MRRISNMMMNPFKEKALLYRVDAQASGFVTEEDTSTQTDDFVFIESFTPIQPETYNRVTRVKKPINIAVAPGGTSERKEYVADHMRLQEGELLILSQIKLRTVDDINQEEADILWFRGKYWRVKEASRDAQMGAWTYKICQDSQDITYDNGIQTFHRRR